MGKKKEEVMPEPVVEPTEAADYPAPPEEPAEPMEPGDIPAPAAVTVYKKINDGMTSFYGEKVQEDPDGKQYFIVTESAREAVAGNPNLVWPE